MLFHIQRLPRCCAGLVLSVAKPYSPESLCWCQHVFALPVDGLAGYSQHPVSVLFHFHLPAMTSGGIALCSQHLCANVKAFGVVWQLEQLSGVLHLSEILWQDETPCCRVGIHNHGILRGKIGLRPWRNGWLVISKNLLYFIVLFIFSHTWYFREPKCLATSIKAPEIICRSGEVCQVLKEESISLISRLIHVLNDIIIKASESTYFLIVSL